MKIKNNRGYYVLIIENRIAYTTNIDEATDITDNSIFDILEYLHIQYKSEEWRAM